MKTLRKPSLVSSKTNGCILKVELNRTESVNALNPELIAELIDVFCVQAKRPGLRLIYLSGAGTSFCSGLDLAWMKASKELSDQENFFDTDRLYQLFLAMQSCPIPIFTHVRGVVFGAGVGLAASSDVVVAEPNSRFALTETRYGLVPAIMLPVVIEKLGKSRTRELLTTGREFDVNEAEKFGLVHFIIEANEGEEKICELIDKILSCAPEAVVESRQLIQEIRDLPFEAARHELVSSLSRKRTSPEAQEGLLAVFENREASWVLAEWSL